MSDIVIDTNPLVYIYHAVPDLGKKYACLLGELARKNILYIPKLVYGELSLIFGDRREMDAFVSDTGINVGEIASETYVTAAKRWDVYNKRRLLFNLFSRVEHHYSRLNPRPEPRSSENSCHLSSCR